MQRLCACCRYMSILAPDAGNCSSMSIQNDMNHKHSQATFSHAIRLRLFLPRRHLHLRQSEGDKVGEQSETHVETHKIMVEHDFILRPRLRRHKGNRKNRDRTPPQRNTHDWRQMTSETDAGTRQVVRHTKADRRKSRTPPLRQTNDWRLNDGETEKLGDTWRDN